MAKSRIKLTEKVIARLPAPDPSGKQKLHWCADLSGFGVRCSGATNAKSFVVQRDLSGGRTRRVVIGDVKVFKLDEARERAKRVLGDLYSGRDPKHRGETGTLREVLKLYCEKKTKLAAKSKKSYGDDVERHLEAWLDRPMREVTREMVEDRHAAIQREVAAGGRYEGKGISDAVMRALRALWNWAADRDASLPANPVRLRGQWHGLKRRTRRVPVKQMPEFYRAVQELESKVQRAYVFTLLATGMRREEAAALKWKCLRWDDRVIAIAGETNKGKRDVNLPMTDWVHDTLRVYHAEVGGGADDWVFPANSKSGHISEPKHPLGLVEEATGIKVSAHDLKRTFATTAESAGVVGPELKFLLSHKQSKDVTEGYIVRLHDGMPTDATRAAAQRACDAVRAACGVAPPARADNVRSLPARQRRKLAVPA